MSEIIDELDSDVPESVEQDNFISAADIRAWMEDRSQRAYSDLAEIGAIINIQDIAEKLPEDARILLDADDTFRDILPVVDQGIMIVEKIKGKAFFDLRIQSSGFTYTGVYKPGNANPWTGWFKHATTEEVNSKVDDTSAVKDKAYSSDKVVALLAAQRTAIENWVKAGVTLNNADMEGFNSIHFADAADATSEGIFWPKSGGTDRLYVANGIMYLNGDTIATQTSAATDAQNRVNTHNNSWSVHGATNANTANAIIKRDSAGGFSCGSISSSGNITASKVYNAVWNDIVDMVDVDEDFEVIPGKAYVFNGEKFELASEYNQIGVFGIASDTFGFAVGERHYTKQMPIAIGGYVLAYTDKIYPSGTPLTCTKDGLLTEFKKEDKRDYPERLVATYWKAEPAEEWNTIKVDGRNWVKIH